jgi:DNA repair exonuclease SbcCD nuclease subunit
MSRILFISDCHYGLKSAGFDRTEEIHKVMMGAVDYAIDNSVDLFVHGGDLGHTSNPSSHIHGLWVDIFLKLEEAKIHSFFMLGNHDIVNKKDNVYGSLAPLAELNLKYVEAIVKPEIQDIYTFNVIFLPYISKANLDGKTLDQINEKFIDELPELVQPTIVFTHLNPEGARLHDDFVFRPVHAVVPKRIFELENVCGVFSGHIHKPQTVREQYPQHYVVGSPITTDFGDDPKKKFFIIDIVNNGTKQGIGRIQSVKTNNIKLVELNYDFVNKEGSITFDYDESDIKGSIIKIQVRLTEDQRASVDFDALRTRLTDSGAFFVRPVMVTTIKRDSDSERILDASMTDTEIVRSWIAAKQPSNSETIEEFALETLEEVK